MSKLKEVKQCARHLGYGFQIGDDIEDIKQDEKRGSLNIASILGKEQAQRVFMQEKEKCMVSLKKVGLISPTLFYYIDKILPDRASFL